MKEKYTNKEIVKELIALNKKFKDCKINIIKPNKFKYLLIGMTYVLGWSTFWVSLGWFNDWNIGIGIGLSIFGFAILLSVNHEDI